MLLYLQLLVLGSRSRYVRFLSLSSRQLQPNTFHYIHALRDTTTSPASSARCIASYNLSAIYPPTITIAPSHHPSSLPPAQLPQGTPLGTTTPSLLKRIFLTQSSRQPYPGIEKMSRERLNGARGGELAAVSDKRREEERRSGGAEMCGYTESAEFPSKSHWEWWW